MKPVFENPGEVEKLVKDKFGLPQFVMMENAAASLSEVILKKWDEADYDSVVFLCGKGNNGADGLAAARMLYGKIPVYVYCPEFPKTEEGEPQAAMAFRMKVPFLSRQALYKNLKAGNCIITDCIYGTGFHGELSEDVKKLLDAANDSKALRIACDISSGLYFKADLTVTMGTHKAVLFSEKAAAVSGEIILSELGVNENLFSSVTKTDLFLIEENDILLPLRQDKKSHKGTYGHALIFAGEKSGAVVLSGEAALHFGSGLTSLFKTDFSNLGQFKITPELMITDKIPKTTKAVQIGSGLGDLSKDKVQNAVRIFEKWFSETENPSCVIDADMFSWKDLPSFLKKLNKSKNARIVLTPHAKELSLLASALLTDEEKVNKADLTASEALENRIKIGKLLTKKYPQTAVVMKGANTFIAWKGQTFIFEGGVPSLAKGGSGDVLAGMITALLAQGYSAKDAAVTAVFHHGNTAREYGKDAYNLTPGRLISMI